MKKVTITGIALALSKRFKLANRLFFTPRLGVFQWKSKTNLDIDVIGTNTTVWHFTPSDSDTGNSISLGIGVQYDVTNSYFLTLDWERYDIDGYNVELGSFSIGYNFLD